MSLVWRGGYQILYLSADGSEARRCDRCGLVYASKVLSEYGLSKYWMNYETDVHMKDELLSEQRRAMYQIEFDYIEKYMQPQSTVLDVGCSNGDFLDYFNRAGHICEGVEFGEDAYKKAAEKYKVYLGDLSSINMEKKYDLIIFRGVIQYLLHPKRDFKKAVSMLKPDGMIYITSSPNADSICHRLFGNRAKLTVNTTNYYMYTENILSEFMNENGMDLYAENAFYLGTPYENLENDICLVAKAIEYRRVNKEIAWGAPAFFDSMLTLIYKKI